jgi:hypothetical protein
MKPGGPEHFLNRGSAPFAPLRVYLDCGESRQRSANCGHTVAHRGNGRFSGNCRKSTECQKRSPNTKCAAGHMGQRGTSVVGIHDSFWRYDATIFRCTQPGSAWPRRLRWPAMNPERGRPAGLSHLPAVIGSDYGPMSIAFPAGCGRPQRAHGLHRGWPPTRGKSYPED